MVEKIILHLLINLGFLTQSEICLADVLILRQTLYLWTFVLCSFLPSYLSWNVTCCRIPIISLGTFFQRPFLRGLCLEWLIFGGAYVRREVCVSKLIGVVYSLEGNLPFLLCFTLYLRAIFQVQAPGGLYLEGRFNGGFFALRVWGAYTWRGLFSEFYGSFSMGFKYGRIPAVSNAHLLEFWMKYWSIFESVPVMN